MNSTDAQDDALTNPYAWGWTSFEVILSLATVSSGLTFVLTQFQHHDPQHLSHCRLIKYLTSQECVWSMICLIQCALNIHHGAFFGGMDACQFQSMYMMFFILMNGFTLCIMAYSSERRIVLTELGVRMESLSRHVHYHSWLQSSRSVFLAHLAAWILSAALSGATTYGVATRYSRAQRHVLLFKPRRALQLHLVVLAARALWRVSRTPVSPHLQVCEAAATKAGDRTGTRTAYPPYSLANVFTTPFAFSAAYACFTCTDSSTQVALELGCDFHAPSYSLYSHYAPKLWKTAHDRRNTKKNCKTNGSLRLSLRCVYYTCGNH